MFRLIFVAFVFCIVTGKSSGITWIEISAGEKYLLTQINAVPIPGSPTYVGRARHFDNVLPAEVWPNLTATIEVCGKRVTKHHFEVLTSEHSCSWQSWTRDSNVPEDLVIVGHSNKTPLFCGLRTHNPYYSGFEDLYVFRLSDTRYVTDNLIPVLVCPHVREWIDISAKKAVKNAVTAGTSADGSEIFVARLQNGCKIIPGSHIPDDQIASAWDMEDMFERGYCQVLIGDSDQYSWASVVDDVFPDNPVVGSSDRTNLYYVAKQVSNNISTYVTSLFRPDIGDYEILVENVRAVRKFQIEQVGHHPYASSIDDENEDEEENEILNGYPEYRDM